jgi:hydrogenase nickel incorporation protein HypA/HybF
MQELSIAESIVDAVTETAAAYPGARVRKVRLVVGALAAVVEKSLQFCWEISISGTELAGSKLIVRTLPVVIHCASCNVDSELDGVWRFRCPRCGSPVTSLRQGRELEIESIELDTAGRVKAEPIVLGISEKPGSAPGLRSYRRASRRKIMSQPEAGPDRRPAYR